MAKLQENILTSVVRIYTFVIGFGAGVVIDKAMFALHTRIKKEFVSEHDKAYLALLGILQLILNIVVLTVIKYYEPSPDLFSMGLFMPQANFFRVIYKPHSYYDTGRRGAINHSQDEV